MRWLWLIVVLVAVLWVIQRTGLWRQFFNVKGGAPVSDPGEQPGSHDW